MTGFTWGTGGPVPARNDLTVALGYAGLDTFGMRGLPDDVSLAEPPRTIGVDARILLAARAPELTIAQLATMLGARAAALESLWDGRGQVRPLLLRERGDVDGEPA